VGLPGCVTSAVDAPEASACNTVSDVEGAYQCGGECVVTAADGSRQLQSVSGETDTISRFAGAAEGLYQINITSGGGFSELEIGALASLTLRTATAEVSDGQFPVLEEYVFETGPACQALSFTKIVRNPTPAQFKACTIRCEKSNP